MSARSVVMLAKTLVEIEVPVPIVPHVSGKFAQ
jgi:hypothetical protein